VPVFLQAVDHVKSQRSLKKSSQGYSPLAIPKSKPSDMKRKLPSLTLPDGTNPYRRKVTVSMRSGQPVKTDLAHVTGFAKIKRQREMNVNVCIFL